MADHDVSQGIRGSYRDVLYGPTGLLVADSGWRKNAIVTDCRRLLAGFMRGLPPSLGVQGLQVGAGLDTWDQPPGTPPASATQTALVDPHPFLVPLTSLKMDFLDGANVVASPTNRLQIVATLGPNVPSWPDASHPTGTLREFGLAGSLAGSGVLIDYVTHPAIAKDPVSTLTRTIWLVF